MCPREKDLPPRSVPLAVVLRFVLSPRRSGRHYSARAIVVYDPTLGLTSIYPRTGAVHKRRRRVCGTVKRGLSALPCMHRRKALTPDEVLIMIRTANAARKRALA
jgi:hypothetical protein